MEEILVEILSADKNILSRRDDLIAELDKKVSGDLSRDYASIKKAINLNVAEIFFTNLSDAAKSKATAILKDSGMQDVRINFVVETFANALKKLQAQQNFQPQNNFQTPQQNSQPQNNFQNSQPIFQPQNNFQNSQPNFQPQNNFKNSQQNFQPQNNFQISQPNFQPQNFSTRPDNTKKFLIGIIAVLATVLVGVLFGRYLGDFKPSSNNVTPVESKKQSDSSSKQIDDSTSKQQAVTKPVKSKPNYQDALTDLSIEGLDLDIPVSEVVEIFGQPNEIKFVDGYDKYDYGNFYVSANNGKVDAFVVHDPTFKTKRGLSVGSTYSEVVSKYGSNSQNMEFGGLMLYEYPFTSRLGRRGLLRFAVKGGIVDYISIRII